MTPVGLTEVGDKISASLRSSEEAARAHSVYLTELKLHEGYHYQQMKLFIDAS